jgi:hypothetical protein
MNEFLLWTQVFAFSLGLGSVGAFVAGLHVHDRVVIRWSGYGVVLSVLVTAAVVIIAILKEA